MGSGYSSDMHSFSYKISTQSVYDNNNNKKKLPNYYNDALIKKYNELNVKPIYCYTPPY